MGARSGPGPTPASPQPAVVETPGANPYRTEGAAGAAGTSGSGNPYADGGRGEDRAAGAGRSGDGAPGEGDTPAGAGRALDSGNLYADAAPGAGRAAGSGAWDVARRGDDAPASASTPASASAPVPASGDDAPERAPVGGDPRVRGLRLRREVLGAGDALARHLDPGDFSADYEDLVTRVAWGDVWSRPGLDRRTRFLLTLTALTAGGHLDELATHTRAALRGGVSPDEIKETLLHASLYCGLPAAGKAFEVARRVVAEEADG
ncbi:carboxymuconolactone decarboxylase family protein [Streptomyces sp. UNOB3_S3]|nr:carboxymuconolactone decarboxylase family protein [Streptomyces sp. UNOB3_S3]